MFLNTSFHQQPLPPPKGCGQGGFRVRHVLDFVYTFRQSYS